MKLIYVNIVMEESGVIRSLNGDISENYRETTKDAPKTLQEIDKAIVDLMEFRSLLIVSQQTTQPLLTCDSCSITSHDVTREVDPYLEEIYGEIVLKHLCKSCYKECCEDI